MRKDTTSHRVRAFLSFTTRDEALADTFRTDLENRNPNLELLAHPMQQSQELNWKKQCAQKIMKSKFLICLVGKSTFRSDAVSWEISKGLELGKSIVAVRLVDGLEAVPEILSKRRMVSLEDGLEEISYQVRQAAQAPVP